MSSEAITLASKTDISLQEWDLLCHQCKDDEMLALATRIYYLTHPRAKSLFDFYIDEVVEEYLIRAQKLTHDLSLITEDSRSPIRYLAAQIIGSLNLRDSTNFKSQLNRMRR